jgi:magnesium transporter
MSAAADTALREFNRRYFLDYPLEVSRLLEDLPNARIVELFATQPVEVLVGTWQQLDMATAEQLLSALPPQQVTRLLMLMDPARAAALLNRLDATARERYLKPLPAGVRTELNKLMEYPHDSAGGMMDWRVLPMRGSLSVAEARKRLRESAVTPMQNVFLTANDGELIGRIPMTELAIAQDDTRLAELEQPVRAVVRDTDPREQVVQIIEQHRVNEVPVVDFHGRLIGVIRQATVLATLQEDTSADIQAMVGASREERALSGVGFAVRKRLPWLNINLVTAFVAASVVGLFESTIAQFTALAVLLPVVAGQSGNAGAQSLAVTMRGLALREITVRHWWRVLAKEVNAGLFNGLAIAAVTAIGVFVWSQSFGLALVIAISMIIAMVAAGFAGALIPILLTRLGQDPAQSSSIILTTITDVVGFFSFLSIATMLASLL